MLELLKRIVGLGAHTVTCDDEQISYTAPLGRTHSIRWDELTAVSFVTTDAGPFVDDMFWQLRAGNVVCTIPSEARGTDELLPRLQSLPGFDNEALIGAMTCTVNDCFLLWRR